MEPMVAVLFKGTLAQYSYAQKDRGIYVLWLQHYKKQKGEAPPGMLVMHKEGRRWYSEGHPRELVEDLGYAIEVQGKS